MKRLLIMLLMGNRLKQDFGLMMAGQVGRRDSEEVRLAVVSASILQGDGARQTRTKINRNESDYYYVVCTRWENLGSGTLFG
jgi:hypothetical protein